MGLFGLFKKKLTQNAAVAKQPISPNVYLLEELKKGIAALGYKVDKQKDYLGLIIEGQLEIAAAIVDDPTLHPNIIHVMVLTIQKDYFPNGIEENIAGVGTSLQLQVSSALNNYLKSTFCPIIQGFSDGHNPDLDFTTIVNNKEVLWHPKLGDLMIQGEWGQHPEGEPFFNALKEGISGKLTSNKFNWIKAYILKRKDGTIVGECLFNNMPWPEGLQMIGDYAHTWQLNGEFRGLKQFMVFRRCDAYD